MSGRPVKGTRADAFAPEEPVSGTHRRAELAESETYGALDIGAAEDHQRRAIADMRDALAAVLHAAHSLECFADISHGTQARAEVARAEAAYLTATRVLECFVDVAECLERQQAASGDEALDDEADGGEVIQ